MEWDDFYQMQKRKNKNFNIKDTIATYKKEQEAFYENWDKTQNNPYARGLLQSALTWEPGQD